MDDFPQILHNLTLRRKSVTQLSAELSLTLQHLGIWKAAGVENDSDATENQTSETLDTKLKTNEKDDSEAEELSLVDNVLHKAQITRTNFPKQGNGKTVVPELLEDTTLYQCGRSAFVNDVNRNAKMPCVATGTTEDKLSVTELPKLSVKTAGDRLDEDVVIIAKSQLTDLVAALHINSKETKHHTTSKTEIPCNPHKRNRQLLRPSEVRKSLSADCLSHVSMKNRKMPPVIQKQKTCGQVLLTGSSMSSELKLSENKQPRSPGHRISIKSASRSRHTYLDGIIRSTDHALVRTQSIDKPKTAPPSVKTKHSANSAGRCFTNHTSVVHNQKVDCSEENVISSMGDTTAVKSKSCVEHQFDYKLLEELKHHLSANTRLRKKLKTTFTSDFCSEALTFWHNLEQEDFHIKNFSVLSQESEHVSVDMKGFAMQKQLIYSDLTELISFVDVMFELEHIYVQRKWIRHLAKLLEVSDKTSLNHEWLRVLSGVTTYEGRFLPSSLQE